VNCSNDSDEDRKRNAPVVWQARSQHQTQQQAERPRRQQHNSAIYQRQAPTPRQRCANVKKAGRERSVTATPPLEKMTQKLIWLDS